MMNLNNQYSLNTISQRNKLQFLINFFKMYYSTQANNLDND